MADKSMKRDSLNGVWILDKMRGTPSMRGYLQAMNVNELAVEAHEKGEETHDTYHTIEIDNKKVKIIKRSRVNNDLVVELEFGKELSEVLAGDRVKKSLATSTGLDHLEIQSSLGTLNGIAHVSDVKRLLQEDDKTVYVQTLTVTNEQTGAIHTTERYFNPYTETPPHLVNDDVVMVEA